MPELTAVPQCLVRLARKHLPGTIALVCFPYAGAGPYMYRDWRSRLEPRVEVIGVQMPGRGARLRESSYGSIDAMVEETVEALAALEDRPMALYGHSMGALVAFETARRLRRLGRPLPIHLFVGAARPPHMPAVEPHIHGMEQEEFLGMVQSRYGGIPAEVLAEPALLEVVLPALRADFQAYESYAYAAEEPLECPVSAFAGDDDPVATPETMRGWEAYSGLKFDLTVVPGGHFFPGQSLAEVTGKIRRKLLTAV